MVTPYGFVLTLAFLFLCVAIYGLESLLRPAVDTRLQVIATMSFLAFVSAVPAFTITALASRKFKVLAINAGAFLAVSVPLGVAAMAFVGWILSRYVLVT